MRALLGRRDSHVLGASVDPQVVLDQADEHPQVVGGTSAKRRGWLTSPILVSFGLRFFPPTQIRAIHFYQPITKTSRIPGAMEKNSMRVTILSKFDIVMKCVIGIE